MALPQLDDGYERVVEQHEGEQLAYYTEVANKEQDTADKERLFVNLSITEILRGISRTVIAIINEVVTGQIRSPNDLLHSLFREDRTIYLGIILILIAFAIYVIDITG